MKKPGFLERIINRFGYGKIRERGFDAAKINRLTADWALQIRSTDEEIRQSLVTMRSRSRDLFNNNDYAKKFGSMLKSNVIGKNGISLQMDVRDSSGNSDKLANQVIEKAWKEWAQKGNASASTMLSFHDMECLFIETVARDGEVLINKIKGYDNPFAFALQFVEGDHLDVNNNKRLGNGSVIRMGVELNSWGKPIAYHVLPFHPGDQSFNLQTNSPKRFPAEKIEHAFLISRPKQNRGIPWLHTAMTRLNMMGGYEEAELIAARVGASKMGFYTSEDGQGYTGDGQDGSGNLVQEASPGTFEQLPAGVKVETFDLDHPNSNFPEFRKAMLRGVASGLNVSYNALASDLEGVNFSSLRAGVLEERAGWEMLQCWTINHFHSQVFPAWLEMALLSGKLAPLEASRFNEYNAATWRPRTWPWVDPLKDSKANQLSLEMGVISRKDIAAEQGRDYEEVIAQLSVEEQKAKELGVSLKADNQTMQINEVTANGN